MPTEENNTNQNVQPVQIQAPVQPTQTPTYTYAGFWMRFLAYLIDSFILMPVIGFLAFIAVIISGGTALLNRGVSYNYTYPMMMDRYYYSDSPASSVVGGAFALIFYILLPLAVYSYFAFCESSVWQGTPGKKLLGMIVTDENGNRLTFGKAFGRNVAKILSGLICSIGYIMAGFTEKRQALHDIIARTLVLRRV